MVNNTAAWIDSPYAELSVRPSPYPHAAAGQLVIRVEAVAVNPLDAIIQSNGRFMYGWLKYPAVMGEDVAGEIVDVGPGVERFAAGDRVFAYALGLEKGRDHISEGGFQQYVVVEESMTAPIPGTASASDAAVLPLALSTAAAGLFEQNQLALDFATLDGSRTRNEVVVIWGGATSVGMNAVQLARAAGYRVIATASPSNHTLLRTLGAEEVFDYRDPGVIAAVCAAAGGSRVAGIFAIAVGSADPCITIAAKTGATRVALASPPVSFYDQPRNGRLSAQRISLFRQLIWKNATLHVRCAFRRIRARYVWGSSIATSAVGPAIWAGYLPSAVAEGRHAFAPAPRVIGEGLDLIQSAVDALRGGVSAEKLVVTLPQTD